MIMITYSMWKALIQEIKEQKDDEYFILFLLFIIITPLFIVMDIFTIPIQILSFIFWKIKGEDKDVKD